MAIVCTGISGFFYLVNTFKRCISLAFLDEAIDYKF